MKEIPEATADGYAGESLTKESTAVPKRRKRKVAIKAGVASIAIMALGIPAAHAAEYYYVNGVDTPENQVHESGLRPSISGGGVASEWVGEIVPTHNLETFRPAPGYQTLYLGSGGYLSVTHETFVDAHQKCSWDWGFAGGNVGSLVLTCFARS